MKKPFLFLIFSYSLYAFSQTQTNYKDSALFYYKNNNFDKAIDWGNQRIEAYKKQGSTADTTYAAAINDLGQAYFKRGDFAEAKDCFIQSAKIYTAITGATSKQYLNILNSLTDVCQKHADYNAAENYAVEALNTYRTQNDTLQRDFAICLGSLGLVYKQAGKLAQAEETYLRSVKIFESLGLTNDLDYANVINSLGAYYYTVGKYRAAEHFLQLSETMHERILGVGNWEAAVVSNNLASLYYQLGNYAAAAAIFERIRPAVKQQLTETHGFYGTVIGNLASTYNQMGLYEKAIPLMEQQMQINEKKFGKASQEYNVPVNNLGNVYFKLGNIPAALRYFTLNESQRKQAYGETSIPYGVALSNLGLIYTRKADYTKADSLFRHSMSILAEAAGKDHPEYLNVLNNYVECLNKAGKHNQAISQAVTLLAMEKRLLQEKLEFLSISELQAYTAAREYAFMQGPATLSFTGSPQLRQNVYDNLLCLKGAGVQNFANLSADMERTADTSLKTLWLQYKSTRAAINKMLATPSPKRNLNLDSLFLEANNKEKILLQRATQFRNNKEQLSFSWQQIRQHLRKNEVAVEYVRYRILLKTNNYEYRYAAMLLRNKDSIPIFVKLCTEDQLSDALQNFSYRNLLLPAKKTSQTTNVDLYTVLVAPMEKYLAETKTIYFSPDGLLHQLAFAAIPCKNGKILMDRFQLIQLTSTRQIIDSSTSTPGSAVLFGGIDYNHQTQGKTPAKPDAFDYVYQQNHRNIADSFVALHYTLDEIQKIAATLSTGERQVYTYTGSEASESNFRSACSTLTPSIIHFATHGFILPDSMKYRKISNPYSASRNPLFRTGLVMAAGNNGWRNRTTLDEDDGILTGLEIASIPQTKTELAVLSACETANGEIRGSEGVFGLQRAFKLAGVKNVLASLWQVPDRETETFMVSFYRNWVSSKNVQTAFYRTQTDCRAKKIPLYYWAGFVLIK